MGTSHKNWWTGRVRHGVGQYFMGTIARLHARQRRVPAVPPAGLRRRMAMLWGYFRSMLAAQAAVRRRGVPPVPARVSVEGLLKGKHSATAELDERQKAKWNGVGTVAKA